MGLPRTSKSLLLLLCYALSPITKAQFKEIGPPPFSQAVARQKIRGLLDRVDSDNRAQTLDSLNALTPWFRDILDDELISGWQSEKRGRLTLVLEPLANTRVAVAVVEFSWRKRTESNFNPTYAPLLGALMARYPESNRAFLSDLMASAPPELSPQEAQTVCRILIDMPDIGTWHRNALQILPHYRSTAEQLLRQDRQGDDQEKRYRAQTLLAELGGDTSGIASQAPLGHRRAVTGSGDDNAGPVLRPPPSAPPRGPAPLPSPASPPLVQPPAVAPAPGPQVTIAPQPYTGAASGTLECTGAPVPQNAEYVFRNLPPLKLNIDYDQKIWEARFTPGEHQTQRLILRNQSSGPQKRCTVHWSIAPGQ